MRNSNQFLPLGLALSFALACSGNVESDGSTSSFGADTGTDFTGDGDGDPGNGDGDGDPGETGPEPDMAPQDTCPLTHIPCDGMAGNQDDVKKVLGLNCTNDGNFTGGYGYGVTSGELSQVATWGGDIGEAYPTLEGERMLILSTGPTANVPYGPVEDFGTPLVGQPGAAEFHNELPEPLLANIPLCLNGPAEAGDCSGTVVKVMDEEAGFDIFDVVSLELTGPVPDEAKVLMIHTAFGSHDYPEHPLIDPKYADFLILWVESEGWMGNALFDPGGLPISIESEFITYVDAPNPETECGPCEAPELWNTGFAGGAATPWLQTTIPVTPGEIVSIAMVLADGGTAYRDSIALADGIGFDCEFPDWVPDQVFPHTRILPN